MPRSSLGPFPKTLRWRDIVALRHPRAPEDRADTLLLDVMREYERLGADPSAIASVSFVVALPVSSRSAEPLHALRADFGIAVEDASGDGLVKALASRPDAASIPMRAAIRTVERIQTRAQAGVALFDEDPWAVWREYDGSAFCDLGREFFYHLQALSLSSALDLSGVGADLNRHVERFAWESTLIARAFSARWFNACARHTVPESGSIKWYLGHCLGKLDLELSRELSDWEEPAVNPWRRRRRMEPSLDL